MDNRAQLIQDQIEKYLNDAALSEAGLMGELRHVQLPSAGALYDYIKNTIVVGNAKTTVLHQIIERGYADTLEWLVNNNAFAYNGDETDLNAEINFQTPLALCAEKMTKLSYTNDAEHNKKVAAARDKLEKIASILLYGGNNTLMQDLQYNMHKHLNKQYAAVVDSVAEYMPQQVSEYSAYFGGAALNVLSTVASYATNSLQPNDAIAEALATAHSTSAPWIQALAEIAEKTAAGSATRISKPENRANLILSKDDRTAILFDIMSSASPAMMATVMFWLAKDYNQQKLTKDADLNEQLYNALSKNQYAESVYFAIDERAKLNNGTHYLDICSVANKAISNGNTELANQLLSHYGTVYKDTRDFSDYVNTYKWKFPEGSAEIFAALGEAINTSVDPKGDLSNSALDLFGSVVMPSDTTALKELFQKHSETIGARALARYVNTAGLTMLHAAVKAKDVELVEQLIAAGADINALDQTGHTPFWHAVLELEAYKNTPDAQEPIVQILHMLVYGAQPSLLGHADNTNNINNETWAQYIAKTVSYAVGASSMRAPFDLANLTADSEAFINMLTLLPQADFAAMLHQAAHHHPALLQGENLNIITQIAEQRDLSAKDQEGNIAIVWGALKARAGFESTTFVQSVTDYTEIATSTSKRQADEEKAAAELLIAQEKAARQQKHEVVPQPQKRSNRQDQGDSSASGRHASSEGKSTSGQNPQKPEVQQQPKPEEQPKVIKTPSCSLEYFDIPAFAALNSMVAVTFSSHLPDVLGDLAKHFSINLPEMLASPITRNALAIGVIVGAAHLSYNRIARGACKEDHKKHTTYMDYVLNATSVASIAVAAYQIYQGTLSFSDVRIQMYCATNCLIFGAVTTYLARPQDNEPSK